RSQGPALLRDQRGGGALGGEIPPDELPAARARQGGDAPGGRVLRRPLSRHGGGGGQHAALRSREHQDEELVNILVCVKRVPAAAGKITLTPDAQEMDTRHLGFTISPHEECAVEEAVRLVTTHGGSSTVLTLGPEAATEQLRDAMSIGIERAVLLETDGREWDPGATAAAI